MKESVESAPQHSLAAFNYKFITKISVTEALHFLSLSGRAKSDRSACRIIYPTHFQTSSLLSSIK
ncbi:hypothetical protein CW304_27535 [Bacillus sp. UFRGS-B20]|nr:hypothetical protein CW304_27535 [Bacillus sp. UFRGS-B20]